MNSNIEKLGAFYLGRLWNSDSKQTEDVPVMLDSRHLVTHAVCLGMTGSGKTGLGINILEEAAIDGIPAIVIDPKGDMTNLCLTFPELSPGDFEPWMNPEDARLKGVDIKTLAQTTAETWRRGIETWGQDGRRIALFRESSEVTVYTPGNSANSPLSILKSFDPPDPQIMAESDLYSDTVSGTITSLLTLLEIESDPLKSREHILLSTILDTLWKKGQSTDLAGLIQLVQKPPFNQVGIFDLDTFYPSAERMKLAMGLNNLLASPDFSSWIQGPPMQIDNLLYSPGGKPRISVISIAHLDDRQRMFVVSLLLNRIVTWMRSQNGTGSLRALLYMDELFGYLPPVAQPPSKKPLLTLLKQARAFGLGLLLCTQNPVDMDYKALSNIGIWMIGRLQTEQDKNRLLDGLKENPALGDKKDLAELISSLGKRVFLMHDIHEGAPYLFHTRWCLSYLSGPLTRSQLKSVCRPQETEQTVDSKPPRPHNPVPVRTSAVSAQGRPPLLSPGIQAVYLDVSPHVSAEAGILYRPAVIACGSVFFNDTKHRIQSEQKYTGLLDREEKPLIVDWNEALEITYPDSALKMIPSMEGRYAPLPAWMNRPDSYQDLQGSLRDWLLRSRRLSLWRSPSTGIVSRPGEKERDFRVRLQQQGRENRDISVDRIRRNYSAKIERLQKQIETAELRLSREKDQARSAKMDTALSLGGTILGAIFGRKLFSQSSISRASTSLRRAQRTGRESKDVDFAEKKLQGLLEEQRQLEETLQKEIERLQSVSDPLQEPLEALEILPKKTNIGIRLVTLCWLPYRESSTGELSPAWPDRALP